SVEDRSPDPDGINLPLAALKDERCLQVGGTAIFVHDAAEVRAFSKTPQIHPLFREGNLLQVGEPGVGSIGAELGLERPSLISSCCTAEKYS
ncbi:MAG: hypothetical protein AB7P33_05015, partial [Dehalococcoidia bacterium]